MLVNSLKNRSPSSVPLPENDPIRRQPDISLAKKELKWEPNIQLEVGLKETIQYFTTILWKKFYLFLVLGLKQ